MSESRHTWIGEIRPGEQVAIGPDIRLRVEEKSGQRARIRLEFKKPVAVERIQPGMAAFAMAGVK